MPTSVARGSLEAARFLDSQAERSLEADDDALRHDLEPRLSSAAVSVQGLRQGHADGRASELLAEAVGELAELDGMDALPGGVGDLREAVPEEERPGDVVALTAGAARMAALDAGDLPGLAVRLLALPAPADAGST
jgi:hypothetical protein